MELERFPFVWKTGRSGGTTNETVLPTENFSKKKGIASDVARFPFVWKNRSFCMVGQQMEQSFPL